MEPIFRLMKKQSDGSFKIVGYEQHVCDTFFSKGNMRIYHFHRLDYHEDFAWTINYLPNTYIEHDKKDMYTGVNLTDGSKIFENDKLSYGMYSGNSEDIECVFLILWDSDKGAFCSKEINCPSGEYRSATGIDTYEAKIIGIDGVKGGNQ